MVFLHCQKKKKKIAHTHENLNDLAEKLGLNQSKFSSKTFSILAIFPEVPDVDSMSLRLLLVSHFPHILLKRTTLREHQIT